MYFFSGCCPCLFLVVSVIFFPLVFCQLIRISHPNRLAPAGSKVTLDPKDGTQDFLEYNIHFKYMYHYAL